MAEARAKQGPSIEKLLDFFVAEDGTAYYQVKWKPTWERADALFQFSDLVDNFWKFVNAASTGNIYNNQSIKREDPVIPPSFPLHPVQTQPAPQIPIQQTQPVPQIPVQTQPSPRTPVSRKKQNPPKFTTPTQQPISRMPTNKSSAPASTVIIDSDEEEAVSEGNSSMEAMMQNVMAAQQGMNPMWNTKTEPTDFPDQKPFQQGGPLQNFNMNDTFNMLQSQSQQQFQFPTQNLINNLNNMTGNSPNVSNGRGRGGGRGRGRGSGSAAKRKLASPSNPSPSKQIQPPVKMESTDDLEMFIKEEPPQFTGTGDAVDLGPANTMKWKDYFESIESYVDGQKVSATYKCKICGSTIAQLGNCSRHFKKHVADGNGGEHECPICAKKFYRVDYLERHLKKHGQGSKEEVEKMIKILSAGLKKNK